LFATLRGRPQNREGVAERIPFPANFALQVFCCRSGKVASPSDERHFRRCEIVKPESAERDRRGNHFTLGFQAESRLSGLHSSFLEWEGGLLRLRIHMLFIGGGPNVIIIPAVHRALSHFRVLWGRQAFCNEAGNSIIESAKG
jgi:hypothetical protein